MSGKNLLSFVRLKLPEERYKPEANFNFSLKNPQGLGEVRHGLSENQNGKTQRV
jgi:hypothetical protein